VSRALYAASLTACNPTLHTCPGAYVAESLDAAREMAQEQCREVFPPAEGYAHHTVAVLPVPPLWYRLRPIMQRTRQGAPTT
jgi:hypothetical protein